MMRKNRQSCKVPVAVRAFTLTEMLIVMAIIVLVISLAVPAFNSMSGTKSLAGAQNQISAFLGRVRSEAIGLQQAQGALFFIDPATDRVSIAQVIETAGQLGDHSLAVNGANLPITYLDLAPQHDFIPLPTGVRLQVLNDPLTANGPNRYVGFNKFGNAQLQVAYGGLILFDGMGRVVSRPYAFRCRNLAGQATEMGKLLYQQTTGGADIVPPPAASLRSQYGFVLFDRDAFINAGGTDDDPTGNANPTEAAEENWLDQNATPLLINRYNGTLIRAE